MRYSFRLLVPVISPLIAAAVLLPVPASAASPTALEESKQSADRATSILIQGTILDKQGASDIQPFQGQLLVQVEEVLEGSVSGSVLAVSVNDQGLFGRAHVEGQTWMALTAESDGTYRLLAVESQAQTATASPPRGYQPRACGFDFNFNGIRGEPGDCNICDGITTDVDGNGVTDTLIYVDGDTGTNSSSCGTTTSPCRTASYAYNNRIGPPAANQIQAICLRGRFENEQLIPDQSGAAGTYTIPATGSQEYDFQYPRYPLVVTSWDDDNDGCYWPEDDGTSPPAGCGAAQTPAIFDGNVSGNTINFWCNGNDLSRHEVAHLTVTDYNMQGARPEVGGAAISPRGRGCGLGGRSDHLFFHDLDIPVVSQTDSGGISIAYDGDGSTYEAYENIIVGDFGGLIGYRGECENTTVGCGFIRFQNMTITKTSGGSGNAFGAILTKAWGYFENVEQIDNVLICSNTQNHGTRMKDCNRNFVFRNNEIQNCQYGINIEPEDVPGFCNRNRDLDGIIIDRNYLWMTAAGAPTDGGGIVMFPGPSDMQVEDMTVTNNIIYSTTQWGTAIDVEQDFGSGSGDVPGVWSFIGNTLAVNPGAYAPAIFYMGGSWTGNRQDDIVLRNNVFVNLGNADEDLIYCSVPPDNFLAEGNIYPAGNSGNFNCFGSTSSLTAWRSGLGGCPGTDNDCSAARCAPSFVNSAGGDFHLQAGDTCARDSASDPRGGFTLCTSCVNLDIDGDPRPQGAGWDAGADESHRTEPPRRDLARVVSGRLAPGESTSFNVLEQSSGPMVLTVFFSPRSAKLRLALICGPDSQTVSSPAEDNFLRLEAAVEAPEICQIEVTSQAGFATFWLSAQSASLSPL